MTAAILKVMNIAHLHTTPLWTVLNVLFEVRVQKHMIVLGEAIHRSRTNSPYLFTTAGNFMTIDFGIGDLL
ncbi:hypothetical protein D3C75_1136770 [compost metagenome]